MVNQRTNQWRREARANYPCGCSNMQHAINTYQRDYCRDALSVAYATRDRTAIAKIRSALAPCPSRKVLD